LQQFKNNLIVFSSPITRDDEITIVLKILESKIVYFHLRKPAYSINETRSFLNKLPKRLHSKIVIHNHVSLLEEYNLKGYYCTRKFLQGNSVELLKNKHPNTLFSKGCHSIVELSNIEMYDYVFLSPIFDSISKRNLPASFEFNQLEKALIDTKVPIYALGGITPLLLEKIKHFNFQGIGILGFLWSNKNPIQQLGKFFN